MAGGGSVDARKTSSGDADGREWGGGDGGERQGGGPLRVGENRYGYGRRHGRRDGLAAMAAPAVLQGTRSESALVSATAREHVPANKGRVNTLQLAPATIGKLTVTLLWWQRFCPNCTRVDPASTEEARLTRQQGRHPSPDSTNRPVLGVYLCRQVEDGDQIPKCKPHQDSPWGLFVSASEHDVAFT